MAHSSDISSTVVPSCGSRYDENLPEHYISAEDSRQNERSQFLPSAQPTPGQQQPWSSSHAVYVHPSDQTPKGNLASHNVFYDDQAAGNKSVRILGLRRRTFFIILAILVLLIVITGAVLGGVLGSRAANDSVVTQSSSLPDGVSTTATSSSTRSPTSTTTSSGATSSTAAVVVDKAALKFPSLAVTHAGNNTHLFTLRNDNNSITHFVKYQSTWNAHGDLDLSDVPATASALTAISWRYSGADEVRLYFINEDSQIIELSCLCTSATACEWNGRRVIPTTDVSKTAGLTAVHWGNPSATDGDQIRLYYANKKNVIYEQSYSTVAGGWGNSTSVDATISEGTGLSGVVPADVDDPLQRVFFVDGSGDVKCLRGEEDLTSSNVDFTYQSATHNGKSYNMTRPSSVASCLHLGGYTSSDLFISVKQISESGDVVEAWQDSSKAGAYLVEPMYDCPRGDDPGGAIAAVGYLDNVYGTNQLFVYSVGGAVTECWWHNVTTGSSSEWSWTSNLIHT